MVAILFFNGTEEEGRKRYKGLVDLGPFADTATEVPYEQVNGLLVRL